MEISTAELMAKDAQVRQWIANPHAQFKAFSRTARRFQHMHPSPRYRVMTFVGTPDAFLDKQPLRVHLYDHTLGVNSWEDVLAQVVRLVVAGRPELVRALDAAGLVPWMVRADATTDLVDAFLHGQVTLQIDTHESAFIRTQWLLLMADVMLNEAIVQVDPFTDETWRVRAEDLRAKRAEESRVLSEIDRARKQYAADHPEDFAPADSPAASRNTGWA